MTINIDLFQIDQETGRNWLWRARANGSLKRKQQRKQAVRDLLKSKFSKGKRIEQPSSVQESEQAGIVKPGFTGELTDALGRRRKYVDGKPVALGQEEAAPAEPTAKYQGQDVKIIAKDSTHGLARVKTAQGEQVVKETDLDMGQAAPPPAPQPAMQAAAPVPAAPEQPEQSEATDEADSEQDQPEEATSEEPDQEEQWSNEADDAMERVEAAVESHDPDSILSQHEAAADKIVDRLEAKSSKWTAEASALAEKSEERADAEIEKLSEATDKFAGAIDDKNDTWRDAADRLYSAIDEDAGPEAIAKEIETANQKLTAAGNPWRVTIKDGRLDYDADRTAADEICATANQKLADKGNGGKVTFDGWNFTSEFPNEAENVIREKHASKANESLAAKGNIARVKVENGRFESAIDPVKAQSLIDEANGELAKSGNPHQLDKWDNISFSHTRDQAAEDKIMHETPNKIVETENAKLAASGNPHRIVRGADGSLNFGRAADTKESLEANVLEDKTVGLPKLPSLTPKQPAAPEKPGFTGIDAHGHKWENGKQVKINQDEPAKPKGPAKAKYAGQEVEVIKKDSTHGLARIKTPTGRDIVVNKRQLQTEAAPAPAAPTQTPEQPAAPPAPEPTAAAAPSADRSKIGKAIDAGKAVEHFLTSKVAQGFAKLPKVVQVPIKTALQVAFSGWTASQTIAERISLEKGSTPEQAAATRATLAAWDIALFKPVAFGTHFDPTGISAAASWIVPPLTAGYLATSAVIHPIATFRAAKGIVRDIAKGTKDLVNKHTQTLESEAPNEDVYPILADALEKNGYDDWYTALLTAAMNESRDPKKVVEIADAAFKANPKDESKPQDDDYEALFSPQANPQPKD